MPIILDIRVNEFDLNNARLKEDRGDNGIAGRSDLSLRVALLISTDNSHSNSLKPYHEFNINNL